MAAAMTVPGSHRFLASTRERLQRLTPREAGFGPVPVLDAFLVQPPTEKPVPAVTPSREVDEAGLRIAENDPALGERLDLCAKSVQRLPVLGPLRSSPVQRGHLPDPLGPSQHDLPGLADADQRLAKTWEHLVGLLGRVDGFAHHASSPIAAGRSSRVVMRI